MNSPYVCEWCKVVPVQNQFELCSSCEEDYLQWMEESNEAYMDRIRSHFLSNVVFQESIDYCKCLDAA